MKGLSLHATILLFSYALAAQSSGSGYVILNPASVQNVSDFVYALNNNDLDRYRHVDHRTMIHFNEGLDVELLSGKEMTESGLPVDMNKVNTSQMDRTRNSQFSLHPSGRIIISVTPLKKGL